MPNVLTNHNSLSTSYRLAWGLWIGCTAIYLVAYLFVADLRGDRAHGLLLASTLVLQAILVPACIWRAKFASRLEAAIRGAAGGIAFSGLTVSVIEQNDTVTVSLTSSDSVAGARGSTGSYPGFEVEIRKKDLKVVRSNYIR